MHSIRHITVAYDGSPLSEVALRRAIQMTAGSPVARVHVVCVAQERGDYVELPNGLLLPRWSALSSLNYIIRRSGSEGILRAQMPRISVHLRTGDPAPVIVDLAYRYHTELILMGAHISSEKKARGSVVDRVLELSDIPVELASPLGKGGASRNFNPLRFAYVFGGPQLRQDNLGRPGGVGAASA